MITQKIRKDLRRSGLYIRKISNLFPAYCIYEIETKAERKKRRDSKPMDNTGMVLTTGEISKYQFDYKTDSSVEAFNAWIEASIDDYTANVKTLVIKERHQDRLEAINHDVQLTEREDTHITYSIMNVDGEPIEKITFSNAVLNKKAETQKYFNRWLNGHIKNLTK